MERRSEKGLNTEGTTAVSSLVLSCDRPAPEADYAHLDLHRFSHVEDGLIRTTYLGNLSGLIARARPPGAPTLKRSKT